MCGIVGYVGRQDAVPVLVEGLARLEYRGYDSAGVAVVKNGSLRMHKAEGKVRGLAAGLPKRLTGPTGIAHTRWATHGEPSDRNAHPHLTPPGASPWSTTASSRTRPSCARSSRTPA